MSWSITDELRAVAAKTECANGRCEKLYRGDLDNIADRIDTEHERECREQYATGVEHGIGASIDASVIQTHGYIELPKDADGEYIRVGDELDGYGKTIEVVELRIGRSGWVIVSRYGNAYADTYAFAHHKPPTVEDVLEKMLERAVGYSDAHTTVALNTIAEYASKFQLKELKEDE